MKCKRTRCGSSIVQTYHITLDTMIVLTVGSGGDMVLVLQTTTGVSNDCKQTMKLGPEQPRYLCGRSVSNAGVVSKGCMSTYKMDLMIF